MERGRRALASLSVGSPLVAAECAESTARQCAVTVSRRGSAAMPGAPGRRRGGSARRGGARERGALRPARIRILALADAGNTGAGAAISVEVHFRNASGQGRQAGLQWDRVRDHQLPFWRETILRELWGVMAFVMTASSFLVDTTVTRL